MVTSKFLSINTSLEVLTRAIDSKGFSTTKRFRVGYLGADSGFDVLNDAMDWIFEMRKKGYETQLSVYDISDESGEDYYQ